MIHVVMIDSFYEFNCLLKVNEYCFLKLLFVVILSR